MFFKKRGEKKKRNVVVFLYEINFKEDEVRIQRFHDLRFKRTINFNLKEIFDSLFLVLGGREYLK